MTRDVVVMVAGRPYSLAVPTTVTDDAIHDAARRVDEVIAEITANRRYDPLRDATIAAINFALRVSPDDEELGRGD